MFTLPDFANMPAQVQLDLSSASQLFQEIVPLAPTPMGLVEHTVSSQVIAKTLKSFVSDSPVKADHLMDNSFIKATLNPELIPAANPKQNNKNITNLLSTPFAFQLSWSARELSNHRVFYSITENLQKFFSENNVLTLSSKTFPSSPLAKSIKFLLNLDWEEIKWKDGIIAFSKNYSVSLKSNLSTGEFYKSSEAILESEFNPKPNDRYIPKSTKQKTPQEKASWLIEYIGSILKTNRKFNSLGGLIALLGSITYTCTYSFIDNNWEIPETSYAAIYDEPWINTPFPRLPPLSTASKTVPGINEKRKRSNKNKTL